MSVAVDRIEKIEKLIIYNGDSGKETDKMTRRQKEHHSPEERKWKLLERAALLKALFGTVQCVDDSLTLDAKQCGGMFDFLYSVEIFLESVTVDAEG